MSASGVRFASVCAALSAATTFLLWLLPKFYSSPADFEEAILLHSNGYYIARLWVNFGHIFLALVAYGAAAYLLFRLAPTLATFGYLWFVVWGFTELLGVTVNLFAVNRIWRAEFAGATPEEKVILRANLLGFDAVWDAMFFLLLVAFLLGSACFAAAALRGDGLTRLVGALFLLAVPLTIAIILGGYTKMTMLNSAVGAVYPLLQPISRGVLAYWLWRMAGQQSGSRHQLSRPAGFGPTADLS